MKKPVLKFSRQWYSVDITKFSLFDKLDIIQWCKTQFGTPPYNPDAWSRWYYTDIWPTNVVKFRDESDYVLFLLAWSEITEPMKDV